MTDLSKAWRRHRWLGRCGLATFVASIASFIVCAWTNIDNPNNRWGWTGTFLLFGSVGLGLVFMLQQVELEDRERRR